MASDTPGTDATAVLAGDCTVRFEDGGVAEFDDGDGAEFEDGDEADPDTAESTGREERGSVIVVEKPDGTVLVHDRTGYRPIAWLTRAEAVSWSPDGPTIRAHSGDQRLVVTCHEEYGHGRYPVTAAGPEAGVCPECAGQLVREPDALACLDCDLEHAIPRDATLLEECCETCSLPRVRVERGDAFDVCVDRTCESLDAAVRDRFDRVLRCPDCGGDLLVLRCGGLLLGCENYPDCETGFSLPAGQFEGTCSCGLPTVRTETRERCLDTNCTADASIEEAT